MSKFLVLVAALLALVTSFSTPAAAQEADEAVLTTAATEWLALIDAGDFEQSWAELAPVFQSAMSVEQWTATLRDVSGRTGPLRTREFQETAASDAPAGSAAVGYRFVHFITSFENVPQVMERVVLLEEGEDWKVAGYFLMAPQ